MDDTFYHKNGVYNPNLINVIQKVGRHSNAFSDIRVYSWGEGTKLEIGSFCTIAGNLQVFLGGNHRTDWFTTFPFGHVYQDVFNQFDGKGHPSTKGDVLIGNDVWVGQNVTIMSGVTIGDGAVIACNSHVVKDVESYTIVGGNPAREIRKRFSEEIIEILQKLKWWEWEDEKINHVTPILCSSNLMLLKNLLTKEVPEVFLEASEILPKELR